MNIFIFPQQSLVLTLFFFRMSNFKVYRKLAFFGTHMITLLLMTTLPQNPHRLLLTPAHKE